MREVLGLLKKADTILCDRINALYGQGLTSETSPTLRKMNAMRDGIWIARKLLDELKEETCEKP